MNKINQILIRECTESPAVCLLAFTSVCVIMGSIGVAITVYAEQFRWVVVGDILKILSFALMLACLFFYRKHQFLSKY